MNPSKRQDYCDRVHTERGILTGCTKQGGWGLRVQLAIGEEQQNILFYASTTALEKMTYDLASHEQHHKLDSDHQTLPQRRIV